jgi:hypothetical protein
MKLEILFGVDAIEDIKQHRGDWFDQSLKDFLRAEPITDAVTATIEDVTIECYCKEGQWYCVQTGDIGEPIQVEGYKGVIAMIIAFLKTEVSREIEKPYREAITRITTRDKHTN